MEAVSGDYRGGDWKDPDNQIPWCQRTSLPSHEHCGRPMSLTPTRRPGTTRRKAWR